MLPTEAGILQGVASSVTNTTTYVILSLLVALILYITIGVGWDLPHSYKLTLSLVIPFFLLEFFLSSVFGFFGIPLNWGTYTYQIPMYGDIVLNSGTMASRFLDFTFNFGLFKSVGYPYLTTFIQTVPSLPEPSLWFKILVGVYVTVDSVIDLIFFYVFFTAIIVIVGDAVGKRIENIPVYAFLLSLIPVGLYSIYVSNFLVEYGEAMPQLQKVMYFFQHADNWSLIVFFGTMLISFVIVMEILATIIDLIYKGGSMTVNPHLVSKEWQVSYQGLAFGYTAAFAIMYTLHSYPYYVFYPMLIIYSLFKNVAGGAVSIADEHNQRRQMEDVVRNVMEEPKSVSRMGRGKEKSDYSWIFMVGIIIVVFLLLSKFGIIPIKIPFLS